MRIQAALKLFEWILSLCKSKDKKSLGKLSSPGRAQLRAGITINLSKLFAEIQKETGLTVNFRDPVRREDPSDEAWIYVGWNWILDSKNLISFCERVAKSSSCSSDEKQICIDLAPSENPNPPFTSGGDIVVLRCVTHYSGTHFEVPKKIFEKIKAVQMDGKRLQFLSLDTYFDDNGRECFVLGYFPFRGLIDDLVRNYRLGLRIDSHFRLLDGTERYLAEQGVNLYTSSRFGSQQEERYQYGVSVRMSAVYSSIPRLEELNKKFGFGIYGGALESWRAEAAFADLWVKPQTLLEFPYKSYSTVGDHEWSDEMQFLESLHR